MSGFFINLIAIVSGIVIIAACFAGFLIYLLNGKGERDLRVVISVPTVVATLVGVGYFSFGFGLVSQTAAKVLVSNPKQTLETACNYIKNGDYNSLYYLYAPDGVMRANETIDKFIQDQHNDAKAGQGYLDCIVGKDITIIDNSAEGTITIIGGSGQAVVNRTFLKQENYEWKILTVTKSLA